MQLHDWVLVALVAVAFMGFIWLLTVVDRARVRLAVYEDALRDIRDTCSPDAVKEGLPLADVRWAWARADTVLAFTQHYAGEDDDEDLRVPQDEGRLRGFGDR